MHRVIIKYKYLDVVQTHPEWSEDDYNRAIAKEEEKCKNVKSWSELDPDNTRE